MTDGYYMNTYAENDESMTVTVATLKQEASTSGRNLFNRKVLDEDLGRARSVP